MNRSLLRLILPALLVIGGAAWCAGASQQASPPTAASSPAAASASAAKLAGPGIALLGGLKVGDVLEEWTIEQLTVNKSPKDQPQLAVELARKGSGITVWIARKEAADNPPISTERYGVSFGHPRPYGEPIPDGAAEKIGAKIADLVRANERTAPTPTGL